ncbi:hypothetical protein NMG60_11019883 [Bertholletia excelsa]
MVSCLIYEFNTTNSTTLPNYFPSPLRVPSTWTSCHAKATVVLFCCVATMENYSRSSSFPESGDSSPASREVDSKNTAPWEESNNCKVKLMCSYGGKITPRPHDNQLSYVGGDTKILAVDRNIKHSDLAARIATLCDNAGVCFKYQLPGEDLDALITVTNDDDLEHMMHEYDRLCSESPKPPRLRLFLFPVNPPETASPTTFGSSGERCEKDKFVNSLNSAPVQPFPLQPGNADFLFCSDKAMQPQPPPAVAAKLQDPIPIAGISDPISVDRVVDTDLIQRHIQDLRIGAQEKAMYRRSDDNLAGGFSGDCYQQKLAENVLHGDGSVPAGYRPERQVATGVFTTVNAPGPEQSVYLIPPPPAAVHALVGRPVTGPTGQGFFAVPRVPLEVYRDQPPAYNVSSPAVALPAMPSQPPANVAGFSEGFGIVRTAPSGGGGGAEAGYPAGFDGAAGRQVYYNAAGALVPPPYQAVATVVSTEMGPAGTFNQEGKVAVKGTQAYV